MHHDELSRFLADVIRDPTHFWGMPVGAEGEILALIAVLVCVERNIPFTDAYLIVRKECMQLTRDVPHATNRHVALCEVATQPKTVTSFAVLSKRAEELARRLLRSWG